MKTKTLLHFISILFLAGITTAQAQVNLEDGLIRHYKLDGDLNDSSTNADHATNQSGVSTSRYDIDNTAFQTDGSTKATMPAIGNWGDSLTISYWFKAEFDGTVQQHLSSRNGTSGATMINLFINATSDQKIRFRMATNGSGNSEVTTMNSYLDNEWNHVVCELDVPGQGIKIILNGAETTTGYPVTPRYLNETIGIGNWGNPFVGAGLGLVGKIDDVRIYNRVLTSDEVVELGDITHFDMSMDHGLIRHYPLNGNANDQSVNNEHGSVHGSSSTERYSIADQCYSSVAADGDNITVPTIGDWEDNLIISFWFKPDGIDQAITSSAVCYSRNTNSSNYMNFYTRINHSDSTLLFTVSSWDGHGNLYSSNQIITDDWNHVVIYHDGLHDTMGMFLNGITTTMEWYNEPKYKTTDIGFGNFNDDVSPTANGFSGKVDEIRFYSHQLNPETMEELGDVDNFDFDQSHGLLAYYPFNNNADDESGNGNHGTETSILYTEDVNASSVSAIALDGAQPSYVNIGNGVKPEDFPFALSTWIYTEDVQTDQFLFRTDRWESGDTYAGFNLRIKNGRISANFGNDSGSGAGARKGYSSDTLELDTGVWHHVVVNYVSPTQIDLYLNTELSTGGSYAGSAGSVGYNSNSDGFIGVGMSGGKAFTGKLDEVRVYQRALTEDNIAELFDYNESITTVISQLDQKDINMYPNPSTGILNVQFASEAMITIFDVAGNKLMERTHNGLSTIDLTAFAKGMYVLRLESDSEVLNNNIILH